MDAAEQFDRLTRDYYERVWTRRPSAGSRVGRMDFDERLEAPTADLIADELADVRTTRTELDGLASPPRGSIAALDRQAFRA